MRTKYLSIAFFCGTVGVLHAQVAETLPRGYGAVDGATSRHIPLRYTPARIQCGYAASATGWTGPRVISTLTARADRDAYLTTPFQVVMQVLLSCDGCDTATKNARFAANHGRDVVVFMAKRTYRFAAFARTSRVRGFDIVLKGDRPFVAGRPALLVDWATYSPTNESHDEFRVDAAISGGYASSYGLACNPSTFYSYTSTPEVGTAFRTYCYSRNARDGVVMWLSPVRSQHSLGSGCTVYADPFASGAWINPAPVLTSATTGYASFNWGVVPLAMVGQRVFTQALAIDRAGGARWSRGVEVNFGDMKSSSHRYNYGVGSTRFDPDRDDARYGWAGTALVFKVN